MYFVYVLESLSDGMRYTGSTSKEPKERLKEHNAGCNRWTKGHKPFKLLHFEEVCNKTEALKKEKFLKSGENTSVGMGVQGAVSPAYLKLSFVICH